MVVELTERLAGMYRWRWKPPSVELLIVNDDDADGRTVPGQIFDVPCACLARGATLNYVVKESTAAPGTLITSTGRSLAML